MEKGVLAGRTAFITGGSGGIGGATAKLLLRDGAAVLLMGRRLSALETMRDKLLSEIPGGRVELHAGDASNVDDVKAGLEKAHKIQNRLDILLPTVGGHTFLPALMQDVAGLKADLDINLITAFIAVRYGVPLMSPGGAIVVISSNAGNRSFPWLSGYAAAKAALEHFCRTLADEFSGAKIRFNCVRAGMTRTDATGELFADQALIAKFAAQVPLGRLGEAEDIGQAIRFLVGPESSWITGHVLTVDGGQNLRRNADMTDIVRSFLGDEKTDAVLRGKSPA